MVVSRRVNSDVGPFLIANVIAMLLHLVLLSSVIANTGTTAATECPMAIFSCGRTLSGDTRYNCRASAQLPGGDHPPQLKWKVSAGKIVGNRKSFDITVDAAHVKSQTITVTLKVHWKDFDRICDRTVTDTIQLR